jgi:signal transduction histidine kinase
MEFVLAPVLAPVIAWVYVPYLFLCFGLPLIALRRPSAKRAMPRDPFRRARPWLIGTATMFTAAVIAFAYTAYAIIPKAIPIYNMTPNVIRELYFADEVVTGFIALSIILLGRAVVANSVLTERLQSSQGFFMRWRNVVGAAILGSLFVALLYNAPISPIYSLLLTAIFAVIAYAMFNWRQYVEHEEFMKRLNPFVTSLHLHDHLLTAGDDSWNESRDLFTALCRDALHAERACLLFDGSMAAGAARRIDYYWAPEQDAIFGSQISERILVSKPEWTRLDADHWMWPLADSRGAIGRLILGPKINGSEYTGQELQVAATCAERILDALAGEQIARVAVSLLRQRIAQVQVMSAQHKRILHDEVLPQIHLALLKVEALRKAGRDDAPNASLIDEAANALTQSHRRLSSLVREMSNAVPTRLDSEGLIAALRSALDHDFRDSFEQIEWHADPGAIDRVKQLPLFVSEVIFFAAQEAIRNAARHGRGGEANRKLRLDVTIQNSAGLKIVIGDDGVGRAANRSHQEPGIIPSHQEPGIIPSHQEPGIIPSHQEPGIIPSHQEPGIIPSNGESGSGLIFHGAMLAVIGGTLTVEDRSGGGTQVIIAVPES